MKHKTFATTFSSIADFVIGCNPEETPDQPVEQGKTETPEAKQDFQDTAIAQKGGIQ